MIQFCKQYFGIPIFFGLLFFSNTGCKKFVDVGAPVTSINQENVYSKDATAISAVTGIYSTMSWDNFSARLSYATGMSSDELDLLDMDRDYGGYEPLFTYTLVQPYDRASAYFWNFLYPIVYRANAALEGLAASNTLSPAVKQQLMGECYFVRAFCFFYLVNFYGSIPLPVTTDYKVNAQLSRSDEKRVYGQITDDLKKATELLSDNFVGSDLVSTGPSVERVRPNKWAATSLLARAYLYSADYKDAETQATVVINNSGLFQLETLDKVFLKGSKEALWSLQIIQPDNSVVANTDEGRSFNILSRVNNNEALFMSLDNHFTKQFEPRDLRGKQWVGFYTNGSENYYYPFKYKIGMGISQSAEYPVLLRLGELYLIRAEARIQQGNISGGITDLNVLRTRATDFTVALVDRLSQLPLEVDKTQALHMLEYERMAELFTEMGHRWFDLKRTPGFTNPSISRADEIMAPLKPTWKSWAQLYPIPLTELRRAPNLTGHQNPGYQQ